MSDETKVDEQERIAASTAGLVLLPLTMIWIGFVTTKLWAWFVLPQFGVKPLTLAMAVGLGLFVSHALKSSTDDGKPASWAWLGKLVTRAALMPAASLALGWIVRGWTVTP